MNLFSQEWTNDPTLGPKAHPVRKNKIFLLLFETEEAGAAHTPSIGLIGWTYYASVSKVIFCRISPCILKAKQFTFEKKKSHYQCLPSKIH